MKHDSDGCPVAAVASEGAGDAAADQLPWPPAVATEESLPDVDPVYASLLLLPAVKLSEPCAVKSSVSARA